MVGSPNGSTSPEVSNTIKLVLAALLAAIATGVGAYITLGNSVQVQQAQTNVQISVLTQEVQDLTQHQEDLRQAIIAGSLQIEKLQTQITILLRSKKG